MDLTVEFAQLCFSHNQDALALLEMEKSLLSGQGIYICLPFVGVILRIADILDFDTKRTPSVLFSHLAVRHNGKIVIQMLDLCRPKLRYKTRKKIKHIKRI